MQSLHSADHQPLNALNHTSSRRIMRTVDVVFVFVSLLIVAFGEEEEIIVSVSPDFIGSVGGSFPLTFSDYSWVLTQNQYTVEIQWTPRDIEIFPCVVSSSNSSNLLCNVGKTPINADEDVVVTLVDIHSDIYFNNTLPFRTKSPHITNFAFWPVSAPPSVPTTIYVNITTSPTAPVYSFDLTGKTSYACVWIPAGDLTWANLGGSFSPFTPVTATSGTCLTPNLGTLIAATHAPSTLQLVPPVLTTFYVVGTDDFGSGSCATTGCLSGYDEFDFTIELINQLGNPYTPAVNPSQFSQFGDTYITITGSGFIQSLLSYSVQYTCWFREKTGNLVNSGYNAKYISDTTIVCSSPIWDTNVASASSLDGFLDVVETRQDDCTNLGTCTSFRISRSNVTYIKVFINNYLPQNVNEFIVATQGQRVYFYGLFIPTIPHFCIWSDSLDAQLETPKYVVNTTGTAYNFTIVYCVTPNLASHGVIPGTYFYVSLYEGPDEVNPTSNAAIYEAGSNSLQPSSSSDAMKVIPSVVLMLALVVIYNF